MNSSMKAILFILPIMAVVAISGCIGTGTTSTGQGVTILNWEPDANKIQSADTVTLRLRVQNQGGTIAKGVKARLAGIDAYEWNLGFGTIDTDLGQLLPANPDAGTAGEIKTQEWKLRAPTLPQGQSNPYNALIRIYYTYSTSAVQTISVASESEFRALRDQGKSLATHTASYSSGPLSLTMTGNPVRASTDWSRKTFPMSIHIENVGGGVVRSETGFGGYYTGFSQADYPVTVTIEMPSGLSLSGDCSKYTGGSTLSLWQGKTADITCDIDITTVPDIKEDKTIRVKLDYPYYTEKETSITVTGTRTGF